MNKKAQPNVLPVSEQIVQVIPRVRAYIYLMCSSSDAVDGIVEETLERVLESPFTTQAGAKITVWVFKVAREVFYERTAGMEDACSSKRTSVSAETAPTLVPADFDRAQLEAALGGLSPNHLETVILTDACRLTYSTTSEICGCAIGTIRSRRHRAMRCIAAALMAAA